MTITKVLTNKHGLHICSRIILIISWTRKNQFSPFSSFNFIHSIFFLNSLQKWWIESVSCYRNNSLAGFIDPVHLKTKYIRYSFIQNNNVNSQHASNNSIRMNKLKDHFPVFEMQLKEMCVLCTMLTFKYSIVGKWKIFTNELIWYLLEFYYLLLLLTFFINIFQK